MWRASVLTSPFGLTEPLFVPAYWNPPSIFHLVETTRFDIESLIFTFAIGGVGAVLYNVLTRQTLRPMAQVEREQPHHSMHRAALLLPIIVFPILYFSPCCLDCSEPVCLSGAGSASAGEASAWEE